MTRVACSRCKQPKDHKHSYCRDCRRIYNNEHRERRNFYKRRYRKTVAGRLNKLQERLRKYGLSVEQYQSMCIVQENKCAVCRQPQCRKWRGKECRLSVDHNHATGLVRGLL